MDLFQLIKQDHQKAKRLFERLSETSSAQTRSRLFAELKQELELHTEVEEKHFYPALKGHQEAKELLEEALEEHEEVKSALKDLDEMDKGEEEWAEQLSELQEDVEDHVEEEETEMFPVAQKVLSQQQLDEIATAIEKDKQAAKTK